MGILDKIEDKLSGSSSNKKEEQSARLSSDDRQGDYPSHPSTATATAGGESYSSRQHPIGSSGTHGTGITGGTAVGSGLSGSATHGSSGSVPGSFPGESNNYGTSTTSSGVPDRTRVGYGGGSGGGNNVTTATTTTTSTATGTDRLLSNNAGLSGSNTDHQVPRKPYDPYSSSGQQIAANAVDNRDTYGASNNRGPAGDTGSRRDYDDPAVQRTQHGGVSNQLHSGPHSTLENRDAVPVAGGQKIGTTGEAYESPSRGLQQQHQQQQHHYGRDAAVAGGAGAAGYGASEATSHGRSSNNIDNTTGQQSGGGQKTAGPHNSDILNKLDPRVDSNPYKQYDGRDHTTTTSSSSSGIPQDRSSATRGYDTYQQDPSYSSNTTSTTSPSQGQHHYGRDAAIAGGAGALGAGAASHYSNRDQTGTTTTTQPRTGTTTTSSSTADQYGQNISYMQRPAADQPLAESRDFNDRHHHHQQQHHHPSSTTTGGGGVAGLTSGTTSTGRDAAYSSPSASQQYGSGSIGNTNYDQNTSSSGTSGPHNSSILNKLDPRVDSSSNTSSNNYNNNNNTRGYDSSTLGSSTSTTSGTALGGAGAGAGASSLLNSRHAGYDTARQNHGGGTYGVGYEKGYEAGYRDALAHAQSSLQSGGSGSGRY